MVTGTHPQLQRDEITDDLSACDSSKQNLKNFCGLKTCSKSTEDKSHEELCQDNEVTTTTTTKVKNNIKVFQTIFRHIMVKQKVPYQ